MPTAPLIDLLARHGGLSGLAAAVRAGELRPEDLARAALARIAELDGDLHAFTQVFTEFPGGSGVRGALAGLPVAVKDNIDVGGRVTTLGRPARERPPATRDAVAVSRLTEAGAFVIGKTNLPELASSAVTGNIHYGDARNPWDPARTAGGSSGGSASAVAAGMAVAALGTDTGGSVLIPSALTGVCGLRPTHGRVSTEGVVPLSPTLDTVGLVAVTPDDLSVLLDVLLDGRQDVPSDGQPEVPPDAPDGTPPLRQVPGDGLAGLRVGVLTGWFDDAAEVDEGVRRQVAVAARDLTGAGASVQPVELPSASAVHPHARTLYAVEAAATFAELLEPGRTYAPTVEARRAHRYGPDDLARALEFRRAWQAELAAAFAGVDVLLTATTPITAPRIDIATEATTTALVRHTYPFCFAGTPALSLPAGTHDGLPVGLMLAGPPDSDRRLLSIGSACRAAGLLPFPAAP
ncbi:amidase [Nonomuraea sp. NEAU-A123]|uniref:amidase n=1 Tax=Nonomuraea sp. NEAU-A123 TaxID=2839649 RepID=UPI001BE4217A|nr:amidase [Nonomuraea sp. NEAU-A123]MBT2234200.1 amidase [Nonomuraea sp. NEAU-A123]